MTYVRNLGAAACAVALLSLAACADDAKLQVADGTGAHPKLPAPDKAMIPTVKIAKATGWNNGVSQRPASATGTQVAAFAKDLSHPRWLYVLKNGDVLVAETDAPPKPEDSKGIKNQIMKWVMKRAGSGVPSANRITLLRDKDGDGVPETRSVFLDGLNSPYGMVQIGDQFYVANTDSVMRFPYVDGETQLKRPGVKVTDLPGGPLNHHWTKNVVANEDGTKLYVTVGSNSNAAENGIEKEEGRASIWEVDVKSGEHRVFASGLRNPNGMGWDPTTKSLWTVVNERDELGSDLVPDYLTSVRDGGFYGWPYSYYGQHVDDRVKPQRPELVSGAVVPDYALGPHTASLGMTFSTGNKLGDSYSNGVFVGQHGSWNRSPRSGYKVIFVPFADGKPAGQPMDVLSGFLSKDGDEAYGRPVGVVIDKQGALLVADDVGNTVWRVSASTK